MKKLLLVMLLVYPLSALAQIYEWTDERGTVNFTEDRGNVPVKYRKKVKVLGDESGAPETTIISEQPKVKNRSDEKGKKLYGGRDETAWRTDFMNAKGDLKQARSELADLRERLGDTSKMSRTEYLTLQNTIKFNEGRLQQLQKKLDALQQSADKLGVPQEFRQ